LTLLGGAAVSLALAGCGSGYQYFSHRDDSGATAYFKVPSSWTTFDQGQVLQASNGPLTRDQIKQLENGQWLTSFYGASNATVNRASDISGPDPSGLTAVRLLSVSDRDTFSMASLRAAILGEDPFSPTAEKKYQVLSYDEFTKSGGLRGSKMVVNVDLGGGTIATVNQVAMVDSGTKYLYLIGVGCRVSCYSINHGVIQQVVSSWTVKESPGS
jgi:hypothetical protein